jgi:hypothetical protein
MQMCQAYWNVLDEPSVPARPKTVLQGHKKPTHFHFVRTGPRPAGIPICVNDLAESRARGQAAFEEQMSKVKDKELTKREKNVHDRAAWSRDMNSALRERTLELGRECGQKWALMPDSRLSSRLRTREEEKGSKEKALSPEDAEAMAYMRKYADQVWQEYLAARRPVSAMERAVGKVLARKVSMIG